MLLEQHIFGKPMTNPSSPSLFPSQSAEPETAIDIALRVCTKARTFSDGEIQMFATAEQFDTFVREVVAMHTKRLLSALDCMDLGCTEPGFQGHENGYGESSAGDELQAAREDLAGLVGHVPLAEPIAPEVPWVETRMPAHKL